MELSMRCAPYRIAVHLGESDSGGTRNNRISENVKPFHDMNTNVYDFSSNTHDTLDPPFPSSVCPSVRTSLQKQYTGCWDSAGISRWNATWRYFRTTNYGFFVYFHLFFHKQYLLKQFFTVLSTRQSGENNTKKNVKKADRTKLWKQIKRAK